MILRIYYPTDIRGVSTTTVIIATLFGIYLVFLVPHMFDIKNNRKAKLARLLYVLTALLIVAPSFGTSLARNFFDFTMPAGRNTWPLLIVIIGFAILQWKIAGDAGRRFKARKY
jgi:type III secretory pathway component EscS